MSEPSPAAAPNMPNICRCGRPRYTATDLARWKKEISSAGLTGRAPETEWARAICWLKPGATCHMKKLEETTDGR